MTRKKPFQAKHAVLVVFGLMTLYVLVTRDLSLLDPHSFLRQRYAVIPWLMLATAFPAPRLALGFFQFSSRLRERICHCTAYAAVYVGRMDISPAAVLVSQRLPRPTLFMASVMQASGRLLTTDGLTAFGLEESSSTASG